MIQVVCPAVHSFTLDFLDLSWQVADTEETLSDYTLRVRRSESPEGPFELISTDLKEVFSFRDLKVDLFSKWRIFYYQVEAQKDSDLTDISYSPVFYMGFKPDLIAMEISRLYQVLLQGELGTPMVVLKRRTSGPHCPVCFDPIRGRVTDSDCLVCLGTSEYRGGFLDPIPVFVNESPNHKAIRFANFQETTASNKSFDTSGYPLYLSGDVLVTPINKRFRVVEVRDRSKRGFVHRQILQVSEIPRADKVYGLEINHDMFPTESGELWPKPAYYGNLQTDVRHYKVKGRWTDDFV